MLLPKYKVQNYLIKYINYHFLAKNLETISFYIFTALKNC